MAKTELKRRGIDIGYELTDKQRAFVFEYSKDYNATRAARDVGYKNPKKMGQRLLDPKYYPKISRAVGAIQNKNLENAILTKEEILEKLTDLVQLDIIEIFDLDEGVFYVKDLRKIPKEVRKWITNVECESRKDKKTGKVLWSKLKITLGEKLKAVDMLMRHFGMYAPDKIEMEHKVDWDAMYENAVGPDNLDVIEGRIADGK